MRERIADWRFRRRLAALGKSGQELLCAYAGARWPAPDLPLREAALLALDFELDGLARDAHVLQAGWLPFDTGGIALEGAMSLDIRSARRLDDSAVTVHGIGEERAREGQPLRQVLEPLVSALSGRVLVAHGAAIEMEVIERTTRACFGEALPVRAICTLELERRLHPNLVGSDAYRLAAVRARYNLPAYDQHDALSDALAAAELLLAQARRLSADVRLGSVLLG